MPPLPVHNNNTLRWSSKKVYVLQILSFLLIGISLFLFSLMAAGCDRSAPENLIDEDQYIKLLTEMHLLAAMRELTDDEDQFLKGQKTVLEHYNITRDQFERSHNYYFRDVREQQRRLRIVRRKLEEMSSDLSDYEQEMRRKRDEESQPDLQPAEDSN